MGRIAGLFCFDGRPISRDDEAWVLTALGSGNPAEVELHRADGLLMGAVTRRLAAQERLDTPERPAPGMPRGDGICTWEGRLDNREDLARGLGKALAAPCANSALALQLYQTRGMDGL